MFMLSKASVKSFSTSGGALARGDRIPRGIPVKSGFSQMVGGVRKRHLGEKSIGLFFVLTKKTEIYSIQYTLENDDLWTAARAQPPVWTTLRFKCWINKTCFHCFGFIINFYITGVLGWNPLSTWKGFWEKKTPTTFDPLGGPGTPQKGKGKPSRGGNSGGGTADGPWPMGNCKDAPLLPFSSARCPRVLGIPAVLLGIRGASLTTCPLKDER